jgi:hypothetical protein
LTAVIFLAPFSLVGRLSGWSSVFPLCHNPVKIEAPTQPFNGEKMQLSEFQILQLAATLAAPHATRYASDDAYVDRMFQLAEAIKRKLEAQPIGRAEVDVI